MEAKNISSSAVREQRDDKLILASRRGDAHAADTLFRRYHRPLLQTALRILGNTADAEDALQDALLSAYRNMKRFEGRSQFSTWLTRIVINAALMKRRSARTHQVLSLDYVLPKENLPASECFADNGPNPEQVRVGTEIREMISKNLDELSPLLRTAFVLREVAGYSTGEAAKKLGVTENTLKARSWRARHQLASRLRLRPRRMKDDMNAGVSASETCNYC